MVRFGAHLFRAESNKILKRYVTIDEFALHLIFFPIDTYRLESGWRARLRQVRRGFFHQK